MKRDQASGRALRMVALALTLAPGLACSTSQQSLFDIYRETLEELTDEKGISSRARSNNERRYTKVRKRIASGGVVSAEDHLYAAGALSTSDEMKDLELAHELALRSAEMGQDLGRILVAETTDKMLVQQGKRQRFGTQVYLDLESQQWNLYPTDPLTTDKERVGMGLPTLAEMLRRLDVRNQRPEVAGAVSEAFGHEPDGIQ